MVFRAAKLAEVTAPPGDGIASNFEPDAMTEDAARSMKI